MAEGSEEPVGKGFVVQGVQDILQRETILPAEIIAQIGRQLLAQVSAQQEFA